MFEKLFSRNRSATATAQPELSSASMPERYRGPVSAKQYWAAEVLRLNQELAEFAAGPESAFKKKNFGSVNGHFCLLHEKGGDTGADRYAIELSWKALIAERTRIENARTKALIEHARL